MRPISEDINVGMTFADKSNSGGLLFLIGPQNLQNSMISVPRFYKQVGAAQLFTEEEMLIYKKIPKQNFIAGHYPLKHTMFVRTTKDSKGTVIISDLAKQLSNEILIVWMLLIQQHCCKNMG
ncbi:MAG: hypothetical protein HQK52_12415 [Oligoflexia bacterium]|nr:hypothetical protein [Oligoflexia bacterium]